MWSTVGTTGRSIEERRLEREVQRSPPIGAAWPERPAGASGCGLRSARPETIYRSSSNLLFGLLSNTDQLDAVLADRALLLQAIEEGIRWEPPLLIILRTATRDTEVCGVPVPAGASILCNLGSANHDETRWTEPERSDIFRPRRPHVGFALGPHLCLGMHLARMETEVALSALFDRLPGLRFDPDAGAQHISGMTFRALSALHVVWG